MEYLKEVKQFWGNTTLIESDPAEEIVSSAVFLPFTNKVFFDIDPEWGVYHRNGQLIAAAAYRRGPNEMLVGQSEFRDLKALEFDLVEEELVYGGPVIPHYGHFITGTLPRLWSIPRASRRRRILCHGHDNPEHWFSQKYVNEILAGLGLKREDFVFIERPSIVKRLWVPRPALEEQNYVHRAFAEFGTRIGHAYGVHEVPQGTHAIYLSKTRLEHGVQGYEDEHLLENLLAARGVTIVHPQELSIEAQMRQLAGARVIGGTAGSAFHTTLFLDRPSKIVALSGSSMINSNFILIDKVKGNEAVYLHPTEQATSLGSGDEFTIKWSMNMPAVAADYARRLLQ